MPVRPEIPCHGLVIATGSPESFRPDRIHLRNNPNSVLFRTDAPSPPVLFIALPVSTPLWLVPPAIFIHASDALRQEKLDMHRTRDQAIPAHT
jgi:hypothetical protein